MTLFLKMLWSTENWTFLWPLLLFLIFALIILKIPDDKLPEVDFSGTIIMIGIIPVWIPDEEEDEEEEVK